MTFRGPEVIIRAGADMTLGTFVQLEDDEQGAVVFPEETQNPIGTNYQIMGYISMDAKKGEIARVALRSYSELDPNDFGR